MSNMAKKLYGITNKFLTIFYQSFLKVEKFGPDLNSFMP